MRRGVIIAAVLTSLVALDVAFRTVPLAWTHEVDATCSAVPRVWMGYADPVRLAADLVGRVLHVPAIHRHPEAFRALTASCAASRGWFPVDPETIVVVKSFEGARYDRHRDHRRP